MKNTKTILILALSFILLLGAVYLSLGFFKAKPGGIMVKTNPGSSVYINGTFVGKSPYKGVHSPGEVNIKLVPESTDKNLLTFETKINLVSGIETIVRREFGETEEESSGDIVSFDKVSTGETSLVVVATPANSQVSIDGVSRGFAPYKTSVISPAAHQITVRSPGYSDRIMTLNIVDGLRLTVFAKLSKTNSTVSDVPTETPAPLAKKFVEVLKTPTGFLRVRTGPGSAGDEIAEVKPGSKYPLLAKDESTGWYKIQYDEPKPGLPNGIVGWVSNQYTKIVDEQGNDTTAEVQSDP